ncbi:MAG: DNA-formamidopyrimidine glycosylase family protein [Myxococcota bacterium]
MPELAEVEVGRKVAAAAVEGERLAKVWTDADTIVFQGSAPSTVARRLKGRRVLAVGRKGKLLWFEMDAGPWPSFHFGMTGAFLVPPAQRALTPVELYHGPKDEAWPPRFAKIRLITESGRELVMTNARRLGRIRLHDELFADPVHAKLGFDPLLELPDTKRFAGLLLRRRGVLKGVLLDQSFAAGVGNWLADEILYQSKLSPHRRPDSLSDREIKALRGAMKRVVEKAVASDANSRRLPRTWLFHHRWGKGQGRETGRGEAIRFETIAGRTTAWAPSRQR